MKTYRNYEDIPQDEFDETIMALCLENARLELFTIPGVWECVAEYYNNAALDLLCPYPGDGETTAQD